MTKEYQALFEEVLKLHRRTPMRIRTYKIICDKLNEDQVCEILKRSPAIYFHAKNKTKKMIDVLIDSRSLMASHVKKLDLSENDMLTLMKNCSYYRYKLDNFFVAFKDKPQSIIEAFISQKVEIFTNEKMSPYIKRPSFNNPRMFLDTIFPGNMKYKPDQNTIDLVEKQRQILLLIDVIET